MLKAHGVASPNIVSTRPTQQSRIILAACILWNRHQGVKRGKEDYGQGADGKLPPIPVEDLLRNNPLSRNDSDELVKRGRREAEDMRRKIAEAMWADLIRGYDSGDHNSYASDSEYDSSNSNE